MSSSNYNTPNIPENIIIHAQEQIQIISDSCRCSGADGSTRLKVEEFTMSFKMGGEGCEARVRQEETDYLSEVRGVVNWLWRACE